MAFLLLLLTCSLWETAEATGRINLDCRLVFCPRALCANPVIPPGECCPSCENSGCKFEGCVNFLGDGTIQWQPSPCFICQCDFERNETVCAILDCFFPPTREDCFGYPVVTRPGDCCPSCDFGIPDKRCKVVPQIRSLGSRNITVNDGDRTCTKQVVKRRCDKEGFRAFGRRFACKPLMGKRSVRFDKNCPLCSGQFDDVIRCRVARDDNLLVGCDFTV